MPAFELSVRWLDDGVDLDVDERLRDRGHLSTAVIDGLTVVVFGTFLDRDTLESAFGVRGDAATERTDAEVAAALYRAAGNSWLGTACGDFAVVVFDGAARRVVLARNHAGTRPVFFRLLDTGVRVGSDFASAGSSGEILGDDAVARFLAVLPPAPGTCLPGDIATVPPAHVATITPAGSTCERYWDPSACEPLPYDSIAAAAPPLRELIRKVVAESAQRVEGPIGMHLTGGIDSALVGTSTVEQRSVAGQRLPYAYAWQRPAGPGEEPTIDQRLIGVMADALGVEVRPCVADVDVVRHVLGLDPADVPVTSTLSLEHPVMAAAAGDGVSWIVSGWGGDELVSYNGRHGPKRLVDRARTAIRQSIRRRQTPSVIGRRPQGYANDRVHAAWRRPDPHPAATARAEQIELLETGHLNERTDSWSALGAEFGLQHGYPLLDRRVIEFVLGLPEACFPRGRELMREVLRGVVPEDVRNNRSKDERARWEHTVRTIGAIVRADGADLRLNPSRLAFLDVATLRQAVTAPAVEHPGKLMRALQFAHDPDGMPLSEAVDPAPSAHGVGA